MNSIFSILEISEQLDSIFSKENLIVSNLETYGHEFKMVRSTILLIFISELLGINETVTCLKCNFNWTSRYANFSMSHKIYDIQEILEKISINRIEKIFSDIKETEKNIGVKQLYSCDEYMIKKIID